MNTEEKIIQLAKECDMCDMFGTPIVSMPNLKAFYHAAQKEALSHAKVSIPTHTMEQEFSNYHRLGYIKGKKEAFEQAAEICKRNEFTVIAESQIRQLIME